MKFERMQMVHRPFNFGIVDEVDSILIDEARTPLIISGPTDDKSELYIRVNEVVHQLGEDDYEKDEKAKAISLRSEEHTSELQSLMRISYAVFCLNTTITTRTQTNTTDNNPHRTVIIRINQMYI